MDTEDIEPELLQPLPRAIVPRQWARQVGCARILTLPHLIGALAVAYWALQMVATAFLSPQYPARLVDKREIHGVSSSRKHNYNVNLEYRMGDVPVNSWLRVTHAQYDALSPGQTVPVKALNILGHRSEILVTGARGDYHDVTFFTMMGLILMAGVAYLVYLFWILPMRSVRLVRYGTAVRGRIEYIKSNTWSARRNTKNGYKMNGTVEYTYSAPRYADQPGMLTNYTGKAVFDATKVAPGRHGAPLTILYNPSRPQSSVPYVAAFYEVAERQ